MYSFSRLFSFFFSSGKTRPHCIVVYGSNMQGASNVHSNFGYFKCTIQCMKLITENLNTTTKWRAPYIVHYIRDRERFRTQLWSPPAHAAPRSLFASERPTAPQYGNGLDISCLTNYKITDLWRVLKNCRNPRVAILSIIFRRCTQLLAMILYIIMFSKTVYSTIKLYSILNGRNSNCKSKRQVQ